MSLKVRTVFVILCISIALYLTLRKNILLLDFSNEYIEYKLVINEVMVDNRSSIRDDEGDFEDWIEIYNQGDTPINLKGFGLSNDSKQPFLWTFPEKTIEAKSFCVVWISQKDKRKSNAPLHTNFKLKNKDKAIILTAPKNNWHDIFLLEPMEENISYGRMPDGSINFYGFDEGTPGRANIKEPLIQGPTTKRLEEAIFSHNSGFYTQGFNLELNTNDDNAIIYYTLDGSIPTEKSNIYIKPILIRPKINEATIVRARVHNRGYPKSKVITQSYFVEKNIYNTYNTPVVSIVTDPSNLFDYEKGIYIAGKVFDQWKIDNPDSEINSMTPANYNQKGKLWERDGSIELIEPYGTLGLIQNIGIRIHGGYSRASDLKSLSLFARKDYDDKDYFSYDFFDNKPANLLTSNEISEFSRILLRTSSTDSKHALFRDAFIQSLVNKLMVLDTQSSKPCIVYINGEYYGIHNIREAYDKNYVSTRYNMNSEDIVIIKNPTGTAGVEIDEGYVGDEMHYNRMIDYVKNHDIKIDSNYKYIETQIDTDNFIEYNVLQIYCDNRDWPGNNVAIWRKRTQNYIPEAPYGHDGRWRWMVFDLDYGFGLYSGEIAAENNSLKRATEEDGPLWPNPPWSTLLLRSLLENSQFKNQFINTFADRLNTAFSSGVVIDKIEAMKKVYYPNVTSHIIKWNLHNKSIENWLNEIEGMKNFAKKRPEYMRQHIVEYFDLSGISEITVDIGKGGSIKINSLEIEHTDIPWKGIYFNDIPITVEAIPEPGFVFMGWEGVNNSQDKIITINPSQVSSLKAIFKDDNK